MCQPICLLIKAVRTKKMKKTKLRFPKIRVSLFRALEFLQIIFLLSGKIWTAEKLFSHILVYSEFWRQFFSLAQLFATSVDDINFSYG